MDLYFVLGSLPLAHYYFCSSYRDSKQKKLYRDIRKIIAIHRILSLLAEATEAASLIGDPSKVALAGSNIWASGIADRMGSADTGLVQSLQTSDGSNAVPILVQHAAPFPGPT